jgi:hypothetical protein
MINKQNFHDKYPEFDVGAYRENNRDLQHFQTEYDLIKHFWTYGRFEKRVVNYKNELDEEYTNLKIDGIVHNLKPDYVLKILELSEESIWEYFSQYLDFDPRVREYITKNQEIQKDIIQQNLKNLQVKYNIGKRFKQEDYTSTKKMSELPLLKNGFRKEYNIFNKSLVENYTLAFFLAALYRKKMEAICLITKKREGCHKFSISDYNLCYHFGKGINEFVIVFIWEYFRPHVIYYPRRNLYVEICFGNSMKIPYSFINDCYLFPQFSNNVIDGSISLLLGLIPSIGHSLINELGGFAVVEELQLTNHLDYIISRRDDFSINDYMKTNYGLQQLGFSEISTISSCPIVITKVFFSSVDTSFLKKLLLDKPSLNINNKDDESFNIVFDIRTNRRKCLNQLEILQKTVEYSKQNLKKKINVFIFGWYITNDSSLFSKDMNHNQLEEQKKFVLTVKEWFKNDYSIQIYDYSGGEILQCISVCKNADLILMNSGSGISLLTQLIFQNIPVIHYTNTFAHDPYFEQSIALLKSDSPLYVVSKESVIDIVQKPYNHEFFDFCVSNLDDIFKTLEDIFRK